MELASSIGWTMGGVFATLVTASATTATLGRVRPAWDLAEVKLRVRSWWVMAGAFVAALAVHRVITVLFLASIGLMAIFELARITGTMRTPMLAATAAAYGLAATGDTSAHVWVIVAAPVAAAMTLVARGAVEDFVGQVGDTALGAMAGVALAHLASILTLPASTTYSAGGAGLLLLLVIVAQGGDVAQFLSGKAFGRRKLAPAVSPNKTVAGLVGGVLAAAMLGGGLALLLTTRGFLWGAAIGTAIAIAGAAGDLLISAIKRDRGVKDAGNLIPGHGGVLDRVDSLLLAAPLFYYLV